MNFYERPNLFILLPRIILYDAPLKMIQGQTESNDDGSFTKLNKYVGALDGHDITGYVVSELMACVFNNLDVSLTRARNVRQYSSILSPRIISLNTNWNYNKNLRAESIRTKTFKENQ